MKNISGQQNFEVNQSPQKFYSEIFFRSEICSDPTKYLGPKTFGVLRNFVLKKKLGSPLGSDNLGVKKH